MIVPWLKGFVDFSKSPMTWALIAFNLMIFLVLSDADSIRSNREIIRSNELTLTGKLYYQYKKKLPEKPLLTSSEWMLLGAEALRNKDFLSQFESLQFVGDQVEIGLWRDKIKVYLEQNNQRSSQIYGLQNRESSWRTFVTYQFMHASWMHLIGNMMMLVIFGTVLEMSLGGAFLIFVYLLGGCFAAESFLWMSKSSAAPMIGASGSLSAVMACYAAFEIKKRVSFFYMISPVKNYYGWIYLPTVLIFPLCFLPDLVGWVSTPEELGSGVAYTAHIGGAFFGALLGYSLKYLRHRPGFRIFLKQVSKY